MGIMDFIGEVLGSPNAQIKKAAERGDIDAIFKLIQFYHKESFHYPGSYQDVFKWSKKAADLGNGRGMYFLAQCYENGWGIKRDIKKAIEMYQKAADRGVTGALGRIASIYAKGFPGLDKDERKAFEYYQKAVNLGDTFSLDPLAECYFYGKGTSPDIQRAAMLFQQAGSSHRLKEVGDCYRYGIRTAKNEHLAIEWYKKAVAAGYSSAQSQLDHTIKAVGPKVFGVQVGMLMDEALLACKGKEMKLIPDSNYPGELGTIRLTPATFNIDGFFTNSSIRTICEHYCIAKYSRSYEGGDDEYWVGFWPELMEINRLHPRKPPKIIMG